MAARLLTALALAPLAWAQPAAAQSATATPPSPAAPPECIAPAKPGGGFDLTCKLAQAALSQAVAGEAPLRISYMPGGVGAIAFDTITARRPAEAQTLVAFSSGSLLNLAHGRFGRHGLHDVRWLAAIGADYGIVLVSSQSPWKTLPDLLAALKDKPGKVTFAAGGTIGSQDWVKSALLAAAAGVDHKSMRFVAFEGGGEATAALKAGHVQVYAGDASEVADKLPPNGPFRVLAVMSEKRLPGLLAQVPTAREQGVDIVWPSVRGFYMGPKVPDAAFQAWSQRFEQLMATPAFDRLRAQHGLFPLALTGPALQVHLEDQTRRFADIAERFGLRR
ncbi:tripartite tricarboxylate transporter substrate binding protein [Mitsuaria sp. WAJ17]|nr:tripartite tricarboxylate transporter substrate binding protein [Mitsuaria sp. WAJ17]